MIICPPNLTYLFHTVCKIISFKVEKKFLCHVLKGYNIVLGAKKTIFWVDMDWRTSNSLFLGELGPYQQNLISMRHWNLEKYVILHKGICWNSHTKAVFWHWKRHMKILRLKIQMVCSCCGVPLYTWKFFFGKKTKISIFGGISKFFELLVSGQILLYWQWLTRCPSFS
jgi:hypothetical protein